MLFPQEQLTVLSSTLLEKQRKSTNCSTLADSLELCDVAGNPRHAFLLEPILLCSSEQDPKSLMVQVGIEGQITLLLALVAVILWHNNKLLPLEHIHLMLLLQSLEEWR